MDRIECDALEQMRGSSTHREGPGKFPTVQRHGRNHIRPGGDKTGRDHDDHRNKAKVKSDAREREPTELERRNPIQSNDEEAKDQHKRMDEMVRQSLNRIERYGSGTQITTTPTRAYMQAAGAHPEAPVEQVDEQEKTTPGSRRGSSHDPKSQTGARNKDDRESNRRRSHDRLTQENRYNGRGDRKRDHGDDDYGGGDDDDPRHGEDKNARDVKKEDRKPRKNYPNGGGGGDDSDPPSDDDSDRGKRNSKRDKKEDWEPRKKRPGGDDDRGGDDPSSDGETEDDVYLPARRRKRRRSPRGTEPGDSETSCASNYRRKTERRVIKMLPIPKSSYDLGDFQFNVEMCIIMASGQYHLRTQWIDATLRAKNLADLQRAPRKLTSLDMKLSMACVFACQLAQNTTLVNDLCNAGRRAQMGRRWPMGARVSGSYTNTSQAPTTVTLCED
jgi:hypothetical protein